MKKYKKDIKEVIEVNLKNDIVFRAEIHRSHKDIARESFIAVTSKEVETSKHLHLIIITNNELKEKCKRSFELFFYWKLMGNKKYIPIELQLINGITLFPAKGIHDGVLYNFVKKLLFPINMKKLVTLLNYEGNDLYKVISQIVILKKINEEVLNGKISV